MVSIRTLLIVLLLALAGFGAYRIHKLEQKVANLEKSADAYRWLSEGVVTLQDGTKVSRAQLLDLVLSKAIKPKAQ